MSRDEDWGWFEGGAVIGDRFGDKVIPDCSDKLGHAPLCGRCAVVQLARKMIAEHEQIHHQTEGSRLDDELPFDGCHQ